MLPRIEELLVPVDKRRVKTIAVSTVSPAVTTYEMGFGDHPYHGIQWNYADRTSGAKTTVQAGREGDEPAFHQARPHAA